MKKIKNIKKHLNFKKPFLAILYLNLFVIIIYTIVYIYINSSEDSSTRILLLNNNYLELPNSYTELLHKPWTIITYSFLHKIENYGFFHLLINLLILYVVSRIFLNYFNKKHFIITYLLGGIAGALFFITFSTILPSIFTQNYLYGASASVTAIFIASTTRIPNYKIRIPIIRHIQIKYFALIMICFFLIGINSSNPGGHIAHLGGALLGFLFAKFNKQTNKIDFLKHKKKMTNDDHFRSKRKEKNDRINLILEKISKSGYDSLSNEEKDTLYNAGK